MHTYIGPEVGHRNTAQTLVGSLPGSTWLIRLTHHASPSPVSAAGLAPATWYAFSFIATFMLLGQFHKGVEQGLLLGCMPSTSVEVQDSLVRTCLYCLVSLFRSVWHHPAILIVPTTSAWSMPILCHCLSITIPVFAILVLKCFLFVHSYYFHVCPFCIFFLAFSWAIWLRPVFVLSFNEPKEVVMLDSANIIQRLQSLISKPGMDYNIPTIQKLENWSPKIFRTILFQISTPDVDGATELISETGESSDDWSVSWVIFVQGQCQQSSPSVGSSDHLSSIC